MNRLFARQTKQRHWTRQESYHLRMLVAWHSRYIALSEIEDDFLCLQSQTYQPIRKDKLVGVIYKDYGTLGKPIMKIKV